jgi:hypothetical protein
MRKEHFMKKLNYFFYKLKWKLIYRLIGKMPVMVNWYINGDGVKKGYCVVSNNPTDKFAIIKPIE